MNMHTKKLKNICLPCIRKKNTRLRAQQKRYQACAAVTIGAITAICLFPYRIRVQGDQIRVRTLLAEVNISKKKTPAEPDAAEKDTPQ